MTLFILTHYLAVPYLPDLTIKHLLWWVPCLQCYLWFLTGSGNQTPTGTVWATSTAACCDFYVFRQCLVRPFHAMTFVMLPEYDRKVGVSVLLHLASSLNAFSWCCNFADGVLLVVDLWYILRSNYKDSSASSMGSRHLISNAHFITPRRMLCPPAKMKMQSQAQTTQTRRMTDRGYFCGVWRFFAQPTHCAGIPDVKTTNKM